MIRPCFGARHGPLVGDQGHETPVPPAPPGVEILRGQGGAALGSGLTHA